jgi:hypothetical protein
VPPTTTPQQVDIVLPPEDMHYEEVELLNLLEYDILTAVSIKKKKMLLFKVRKIIQENMTLSSEHNSDVYNFVDIAMKKAGMGGFTVFVFCFFLRFAIYTPKWTSHTW